MLWSAARLWFVAATAACSTSRPRIVRLSDLPVVLGVPTLLQSLHCSEDHIDCWQKVSGICVQNVCHLFLGWVGRTNVLSSLVIATARIIHAFIIWSNLCWIYTTASPSLILKSWNLDLSIAAMEADTEIGCQLLPLFFWNSQHQSSHYVFGLERTRTMNLLLLSLHQNPQGYLPPSPPYPRYPQKHQPRHTH